jgi:hypothetical protein
VFKHGKTDVLKGVYDHFKAIIAPAESPKADRPLPESLPQNLYDPLPEAQEAHWLPLMQEVTIEEVEKTIAALPKGKSPGPDGLTYEIYSQLYNTSSANSMTNLKALTELINCSLKTSNFPTEASHGETILLPKDFAFRGDMSRTRPITLLDSYRKILEAIVNKRLNKILRDHDTLKGLNYGFKRGAGTSNAITIIRHLIDTAKNDKKKLLMAILDVQAAYDTVPMSAVESGLRRIKAPESFISLLKSMESNRSQSFLTPYGPTEKLRSTRGLPQGGILSPTLWNIFYDPLLCAIQQLTTGYTIPSGIKNTPGSVKVTSVSFADDCHPFSQSNRDCNHQLLLINDFLDYHGMTMGARKSKILCNNQKIVEGDDTNLINVNTFKLGPNPITTIVPANSSSRILGVQISMSANSKITRAHVKKSIESQLKFLLRRHIPGKISAYFVNAVYVSRLLYYLQATHVNVEDYKFFDIA